jgi:hypothetical protein
LWENQLLDALSSKVRVRRGILYEAGEMGIMKLKEYVIVVTGRIAIVQENKLELKGGKYAN